MTFIINDPKKKIELAERKDVVTPNLLDYSAGPFKLENPQKNNYVIFDKTKVTLVQGKTYCISCQTNGTLVGKTFDGTMSDGVFQFYFYDVDNPSNYFLAAGNKLGNSVTFNYGNRPTGSWKLCIQFKGLYTNLINTAPTIHQIKIEEGSIPTPWIPSSQDLANVLSKMGGIKLHYKLYYATPVKEVA